MNRLTKGIGLFGRVALKNGATLSDGAGAPTDGTSGTGAGQAQPGSQYIDVTNGRQYINTGTKASPVWSPVTVNGGGFLNVRNETGSSIAADKLVYISGYSTAQARFLITLADADAALKRATFYTPAAIANNANGIVAQVGLSTANLNTNSASAAGDPMYLDTTAGGFTHTAPTATNAIQQIVGYVAVKSATVGQIAWNLSKAPDKIGTNEMQIVAAMAVAAGYKIARGVHRQAAAADTQVTGLATVVAACVSFDDAPTVKQLFARATIGDQAGTPAAGSIIISTFKPTAVNDVTPLPATDFTDNIDLAWIAVGT